VLKKLQHLTRSLTIYGMGDVATTIVSFFLLPVYVRYLSPSDYGIIALLLTVEVVAKIVFRWGVDASFMRLYFDCQDHRARQVLASTIFFFLLATNSVLLALALLAAPLVADHLFGVPGQAVVLRLVLVNTFVIGFYFIPFHVLRIQDQSRQFSLLTFTRAAATLVLRLALVVVGGLGVLGVVLADILVSIGFTIVLLRWFVPLIRPVFSREVLIEALRFGLPRIPHGVAQQVMAISDRYLLNRFLWTGLGMPERERSAAALRDIGVYSIGASFALAMKLFLSAFEYAWAPFYFATMKEPGATRTFSTVTTYGLAILLLLAAGLSAIANDLVRLMTEPQFYGAARVIPWVAAGVVFQGLYLLTSIGLNITKHTEYYPVSTTVAAAVSIGANVILIPRYGMIGAAWSNLAAYGVLAATAMWFSQRFYPISYEWGRIARLVGAAVIVYALAVLAVPQSLTPAAGLLTRGCIVAAGFPLLLLVSGFFSRAERTRLRALAASVRPIRVVGAPSDTVELAGELVGSTLPGPEVNDSDSHGTDTHRGR
jgi:O-antigen/teichoic acid export membrane protein